MTVRIRCLLPALFWLRMVRSAQNAELVNLYEMEEALKSVCSIVYRS